MKTLQITLLKSTLLLMFLAAVLSSCSSDDDTTSSIISEQDDFVLTAKVDGEDFSIDNVAASAFSSTISDVYLISAQGDPTVVFAFGSSPSDGTFTTAEGESLVMTFQTKAPLIVWGATEGRGLGTITISEDNATFIKGTFSFTGVNLVDNTTKEITEGKFKARKF